MTTQILLDRVIVTDYFPQVDDAVINDNSTLPVYSDIPFTTDQALALNRTISTEDEFVSSSVESDDSVTIINSSLKIVQILLPVSVDSDTTTTDTGVS